MIDTRQLKPLSLTPIRSLRVTTNRVLTMPRIDTAKALELRLKGLSYSEIGKQFNVSKQAVNDKLKRFAGLLDDPESINAYKANTDILLTAGQLKLLSTALDNKVIKKSSTLQLISSYGILFDKQRIINNLSTANISIRDNALHLETIKNDLVKQIALLSTQDVVIDPDDTS